MAYLDETALGELWARIGETFARLTQAIGRVVKQDTTLYIYKANGTLDASYNLDDGLATDAQAAAADGLTMSGTSLKLANCDGAQKSNVDLATNLDPRYGGTLAISGQSLSLKAKNGTNLNSVTLPTTDTQPIYDHIKRYCASSVQVQASGTTVTVTLYNGENHVLDYDSATITTT